MNLPNKLTLSRILLVPVFMIFILPIPDWVVNSEYLTFIHSQLESLNKFILGPGKYIAAGIFIVASLTDGVDGYIARKTKQVTKMGKFLDPIADKLLVTAALIVLLQNDRLSGWAAMFIIGREFIVTGLRLIAAGEGVVIAASNWGKIKTATQMVAIVLSLLDNYPLSLIIHFPFDRVAMFIAVIVTIYSGYDYIAKNSKLLEHR
ncbi:CDP-diacylglycerol--glycerol-3-phosphate 3-phosphatidyltransferase [Pseudobacteroides cellulosolvens]|uniref:CDP-diacylglycerol--glycerol-3-phosphate 3-phosphatidyltransferase n=1 Tax=Pseudobacteroides cellulosolvens ATCC 35603 = DSM 2933 TaxID=398512 RepID=A0A0L6JKY4_9FIRM|nr:CDP-diacylglycerol--glycerol-3-phosphate 3-phosphatidyltransferase [Pseudobacteroides cellulosolvens]KNY26042.1 CDP-diacylglycerol/glycerol-3-phosphate 3-phosphatidyltransferase [Pseudobacteroides cellulosolvens ATCC 35603 = DSM 2933]